MRPLCKAFGITESQLVMPCLDLCPKRLTWGVLSGSIYRQTRMSVTATYIFFSLIPLHLQWVFIVHSVNLKLENKPEVISLGFYSVAGLTSLSVCVCGVCVCVCVLCMGCILYSPCSEGGPG